ncbi:MULTISPECIES: lipopolysaccharide biosynthesis protein [unclassified Streptomyces]|uniref:lipopolysaccharide biosynthesis protein n=1 Tax=unclassified Streptomyces TaxID=2593676 RepID=UPI003D89BAEF
MSLLDRIATALPQGTAFVGAGTAVLGAASYVHLAAAGHTLAVDDMASFSVLWTVVFSIGLGLFFPVEQEITRIVAGRVVRGDGALPVLRRGAVLSFGLLAVVLVPLALFARPLADLFFHGDTSLVLALAGAFTALAVAYVTRGVLAGLGRFEAYGMQLGLDGVLRIVLSGALAVAGVQSAFAFAAVLTVAPLLAVLATIRPVFQGSRPGSQAQWRELIEHLGLLVGSTLLAQLLVNIAVISTKLIATDNDALVAALLSALILARVPLFVFGAFQVSLLAGLSSAAAEGDTHGYRRLLLRATSITAGLGVAGGIGAVALGPALLPAVFGTPDVLGATDFAWLSLGTTLYMLAMVLGQALLTSGGARMQLMAWIVGTVVLVAVTLSPLELRDRVELAYTAGSLTVATCMSLVIHARVSYRPARS